LLISSMTPPVEVEGISFLYFAEAPAMQAQFDLKRWVMKAENWMRFHFPVSAAAVQIGLGRTAWVAFAWAGWKKGLIQQRVVTFVPLNTGCSKESEVRRRCAMIWGVFSTSKAIRATGTKPTGALQPPA